ncbi:MAG: hypothetical protein ABSB76_35460 [Streptosporangiaceae bacterium]
MTSTEQTRALVTEMFERWEQAGDTGPFLAALADDLCWTVTGSSPIAGDQIHEVIGFYDSEKVSALLAP